MITSVICTCICVLVITISAGYIITYRRKTRKLLENIDVMIEQAISGTFEESKYDESMLSAIETRMAHYLSFSDSSTRNLKEEKEKIKGLISDISHQTKTPVANIVLYTQLLEELDLNAEGKAYVNALEEQVKKLSILVDFLVKTSRLENGILVMHPEENEIKPMLDEIERQIHEKAKENNIKIEIQESKEKAVFDPKWTMEALYNIVDNAVKYTACKTGQTEALVKINVTCYEMFLKIDISDNGIGMEEEETAKIFGRFYRSKSVSQMEGVGIGLYLARQIVSKENGYICVSSVRGEGTTFSVFLPREEKNETIC